MIPALAPILPPEGTSLPDRLQWYSRYVALVAEQLEATERGNAGRVRELEEERQKLQRELEGAADAAASPPHQELHSLLDAGLQELEQQAGQKENEREMWDHLQNGAFRAAHFLGSRSLRVGQYRSFAIANQQVDLRF